MEDNNQTFTPPNPLKTAILFLVFNRLDTTKRVFEAIQKAKPPRLYIAGDGPRETQAGENETVQIVRDYVINNINWQCDVKTLFREKNLGCKYSVSGAINWFFENEDMGIILEDDCLPSQSFFWFCEELLSRYKENDQIAMITGTNYLTEITSLFSGDYFYSNYFAIWGWASWKRAWKGYDVDLKNYKQLKIKDLKNKAANYLIYLHYKFTFDLINEQKIDTWDIQWFFHSLMNSRLCIAPSKNLISNIGTSGTHTSGKTGKNIFLKPHEFEDLNEFVPHTSMFYPNSVYDLTLYRRYFYKLIISRMAIGFLIKIRDYFRKKFKANNFNVL